MIALFRSRFWKCIPKNEGGGSFGPIELGASLRSSTLYSGGARHVPGWHHVVSSAAISHLPDPFPDLTSASAMPARTRSAIFESAGTMPSTLRHASIAPG